MNRSYLMQLLILSSIIFGLVSYTIQTYENIFSPNFELSDCASYRNAAHFLFFENGKPHPTRPPIFPFFVGLPSVFSKSESFGNVSVMFFNFSCHLLTLAFLYKTLEKILNPQKAFYLSLFFALNIGTIVINNQTLTEPLYTCVLILMAYFIQRFFNEKNIENLFWAYFLLTSSILIRPTLMPFWILITPFIFMNIAFFNKQKLLTIIAFLIPLSILGFQMKRMNQFYGKPTISHIGELAIFTYLTPYAAQYELHSNWESRLNAWEKVRHERMKLYEQKDTFSGMNWVVLSDSARSELKEMITQKPKSLAITYTHHVVSNAMAYSMLVLWLENKRNDAYFDDFKRAALIVSRLQNAFYSSILLIIFPMFLFLKQNNKTEKYLLMAIGFTGQCIIFASGVSITQGDRFHLVIVPLALVIISIGLKNFRWLNKNTEFTNPLVGGCLENDTFL